MTTKPAPSATRSELANLLQEFFAGRSMPSVDFDALAKEIFDAVPRLDLDKRIADWAAENGLEIEVRKLTQGKYEKWSKIRSDELAGKTTNAEIHGALLRSALKAGVLRKISPPDLTPEGVDELDPVAVRYYGEKLAGFYVGVTNIPLA